VYRAVGLPLPEKLPPATEHVRRRFADLIARIMPFDLVIDEETADGQEARVSRTSVSGSWGAVAGTLRYFADRFGTPRASIEGTQIPASLIRRYAVRGAPAITYEQGNRRDALVRSTRVTYFGFELERETEYLDLFEGDEADEARRALALALAGEEARHPAVKRNRDAIRRVREYYRRSGGRTPRLGLAELTALYEDALRDVQSIGEYRARPLRLELDSLVPEAERDRLDALPVAVTIREREVPLEYDVEERDGHIDGIVRLVLAEKMARTLAPEELPVLDRPVRFVVHRGARGAVRAARLEELQALLDQPWMPDERDSRRRQREDEHARKRRDRATTQVRSEFERVRRARERQRVNPKRRRGR
jgi:hypothetical protein